MEECLPRKLAAILYADVAGYGRLTGEDEDATHRTLGDYLDRISSVIESHRGQVMQGRNSGSETDLTTHRAKSVSDPVFCSDGRPPCRNNLAYLETAKNEQNG